MADWNVTLSYDPNDDDLEAGQNDHKEHKLFKLDVDADGYRFEITTLDDKPLGFEMFTHGVSRFVE